MPNKIDGLDVYKITIDDKYSNGEDLGIEQIAFVKNPAIIVKGMAFNTHESAPKEAKKMRYTDDLKMRIAAPALIPMEIYRNDEEDGGEEYYVQFERDVVEEIFVKFMKDLTNKDKFNLEHDSKETVPAFVLEAWLVGDKNLEDRSYSEFGVEVPPGTLFIVSQITDTDYYTELVSNDQTGYSIEGFLGFKLSEIVNKNKNKYNMKKKIFSNNEKSKFAMIKEISKWEIETDNETFAVGDKVTYTYDGVSYGVNDGEYELEDGSKIFVDSDSIIQFVKPAETAAETTEEVVEEVEANEDETTEDTTTELAEDTTTEEVEAASEDETTEEVEAEEDTTETTEEETTLAIDEAELMALMQPKLDELTDMIAELKVALENKVDKVEDTTEEKTEMSIHQKYAEMHKFIKD